MSRADQVVAAVEGATLEDSFGQTVVRVPREGLVDAVQVARDAGFIMFIDLCAVDYLSRNPRYEVVVNLLSLDPPERVRILAGIPGEDPTIASITGIYAGADFYERETFDLFGIGFEGHPDLTRILLPEEWEGHPLRKDHPMGSVPVVFKHTSEQSS